MAYQFFDRDLSWLTFNGRILDLAGQDNVPLMERINFMSIFSSNLDEFYRVRMPVLQAMDKLGQLTSATNEIEDPLTLAQQLITAQQQQFGKIFAGQIIPLLKKNNIYLLVNEPLPAALADRINDYLFSQVMAFLQPAELSDKKQFFPQNNELYFLIMLEDSDGKERIVVLNIPSDQLPRFYKIDEGGKTYVLFLDDIIRYNLGKLFRKDIVKGCYSFKITRDAELDLKDEYPGDISEQIQDQLKKRDLGIATRFLHQPGIPLRILQLLCNNWGIESSNMVEGGNYHNLKDLFGFPVSLPALRYDKWPTIYNRLSADELIFDQIEKKDVLINTPYQSYDTILRFFNAAALDETVEEVYVTLYRVARDSRIANALINAASAGKKVTVLVELKARFDEANNIKWANRMKNAGVDIVYSVTALKVHAKVAMVKRRINGRVKYYGLLATGNFNENTAAFYTDHILMTANKDLLREIELLFIFLAKREKPTSPDLINFEHLLVAQFNLQDRFLAMIDREMSNAAKGLPASITIKLNNLEEQLLISKLYDASQAGVKISLIVRSICCLVPGVKGMSENITIKRIVDRYLEHGRAFIFHNNGTPEVYLGSADWMNRNIYRRIEVCFPVYDEQLKTDIINIINIQLADNVQAVMLNEKLQNVPVKTTEPAIQSQREVYNYLSTRT
ncbi:polyphosphate kinase 1 [Mucilaginibacter corticis]|uniref:Polyphosphate kinase n=1 Tax=Mucilaginibacter corticis TaxID=2597670 RepID=A0A556MVZ0_9SPHI|nr:polyphosphate kinase 1 [Mucilaginibacter corticis]TSJ43978.1 polyphosphate kinase 1 [Mucilaginibacter corticis]